MKAKLKLLVAGFFVTVMILEAYLLNLNVGQIDSTDVENAKSTGNYIDVSKLTDEVFEQEVSTEENIQETKEESEKLVEETDEVQEEVIIEDPIVYDGKTFNELTNTINNSLASTLTGKGELIVSYSLERGVDPYLATAIMLHETGCKWGCSYLVTQCNNVGGQKGSGCGAYGYFPSLDEGIMAFIDNLYNNYISYGLLTADEINPKYAEDPSWSENVNKYIEIIKAQ